MVKGFSRRPGLDFTEVFAPTARQASERYKGRLVAKGFSQRPGLDFTEVFAPTARQASIRLILALAAIEDLHLRSIDISLLSMVTTLLSNHPT